MTQSSFALANQSGSSYRAAVNGAFQALAGWNWGPTAPTETYALQPWVDTSAAPTLIGKQRNYANSAWITVFVIDASGFRPYYNGAVVGDAAAKTVGTGAGNVVALDGSGRLPAVSGELLTNLPSAGRMILIEEINAASNPTLDFTTDIDGTYDEFMLRLDALRPATDDAILWLRISEDGGATFESGASFYQFAYLGRTPGDSVEPESSGASYIRLTGLSGTYGVGTATGEPGLSGWITFSSPDVAREHLFGIDVQYVRAGGPFIFLIGGGRAGSSNAFNGLQIGTDAANIASGAARLYGIQK